MEDMIYGKGSSNNMGIALFCVLVSVAIAYIYYSRGWICKVQFRASGTPGLLDTFSSQFLAVQYTYLHIPYLVAITHVDRISYSFL